MNQFGFSGNHKVLHNVGADVYVTRPAKLNHVSTKNFIFALS